MGVWMISKLGVRYVLGLVAILLILSIGYYVLKYSQKTTVGTSSVQERAQENVDVTLKFDVYPDVKVRPIVVGRHGYGESVIEVYSKLPVYFRIVPQNFSGVTFSLMGKSSTNVTSDIQLVLLMKQFIKVKYTPIFGKYKLPSNMNLSTFIRDTENKEWKFYHNYTIPIIYDIYDLMNIKNFNMRVFVPVTFEQVNSSNINSIISKVYNDLSSLPEQDKFMYGIYAVSRVDSSAVYTLNITFTTKCDVVPLMMSPIQKPFYTKVNPDGSITYYMPINWTMGSILYVVFRGNMFGKCTGKFGIQWLNIYVNSSIGKMDVQVLNSIDYDIVVKSDYGLVKNNVRDIYYNFLVIAYPSEVNSNNIETTGTNLAIVYKDLQLLQGARVADDPFLASEIPIHNVYIVNNILGNKDDMDLILMSSSASNIVLKPTIIYGNRYISPENDSSYFGSKKVISVVNMKDGKTLYYAIYYDPIYLILPYDNNSKTVGGYTAGFEDIKLSYTLEGGFPVLQAVVDYYFRVDKRSEPLAISYTTPSSRSIFGEKVIYVELNKDKFDILKSIGDQMRDSDYKCDDTNLNNFNGCGTKGFSVTNKGNSDNMRDALLSSGFVEFDSVNNNIKLDSDTMKRLTLINHAIGLAVYYKRDDVPKFLYERKFANYIIDELAFNFNSEPIEAISDFQKKYVVQGSVKSYNNIIDFIASVTTPPYFALSDITYGSSTTRSSSICGSSVKDSCYIDLSRVVSGGNSVTITELPFVISPATLVQFYDYSYHYPTSVTIKGDKYTIELGYIREYPLLISSPAIWYKESNIYFDNYGNLKVKLDSDWDSLAKYLQYSITFSMINKEFKNNIYMSGKVGKSERQNLKKLIIGTNTFDKDKATMTTGTTITLVSVKQFERDNKKYIRVSFLVEVSLFGYYSGRYTNVGFTGVPTLYTILNGMIVGNMYNSGGYDSNENKYRLFNAYDGTMWTPFWVGFVMELNSVNSVPIGSGLKYYQTFSIPFSFSLLTSIGDSQLANYIVISPLKFFIPNRAIAGNLNDLILQDTNTNSYARGLGVLYNSVTFTGQIVAQLQGLITRPYYPTCSFNDIKSINLPLSTYLILHNKNEILATKKFDRGGEYDRDGLIMISLLSIMDNFNKNLIRFEDDDAKFTLEVGNNNEDVLNTLFIPKIATILVARDGNKMSQTTKDAILYYPFIFNPIFPEYDSSKYNSEYVVRQYSPLETPWHINSVKIVDMNHKGDMVGNFRKVEVTPGDTNRIFNQPYYIIVMFGTGNDIHDTHLAKTVVSLLSGEIYDPNALTKVKEYVNLTIKENGKTIELTKPNEGLIDFDMFIRHQIVDYFTYPAIVGTVANEIEIKLNPDDKQMVNGIMTSTSFWITTGGLIGFRWGSDDIKYQNLKIVGLSKSSEAEYRNLMIDIVILNSMYRVFNIMSFQPSGASNKYYGEIVSYDNSLKPYNTPFEITIVNNFEQVVRYAGILNSLDQYLTGEHVKSITYYDTMVAFAFGLNTYYPQVLDITKATLEGDYDLED